MKKRKVIITKLPEAKSGVEVKLEGLRAGLGFNANQMPWPVMAGKMSEPGTEVRKTLPPVPRHMANLEAEKDEIAMIPDKGGIPSTFVIGGKRHHSGGTPLFLPSDSFIFSDTAKMRIKDETILKQFGMSPKKKGYTPAEIAKKYDVNDFKKVLADPNSDDLQRETAELMIANYNLKLAKLAIYQESMKGFPQGMPQVGMPYLEEMEIDPAQFVQMNPGEGQDDTGEADNISRFGGPHYLGGGSYKFNEFSPNAGAEDAYEGIEGVEGVEGQPLTGPYQDWKMTGKEKAGLSGIAKTEGILAGTAGATALARNPYKQYIEKEMRRQSMADFAMTPVEPNQLGRKGRWVQTGMATGQMDPLHTGNLVQQPGMNYAAETVSVKFGGDIDHFAPGGYIPKAQTGLINQMIDQELYPGASSQMQNVLGNKQQSTSSTGLGQMIEAKKTELQEKQEANERDYYNALKDAQESAAVGELYNRYNKAMERYKAGDVQETWMDYLPWTENSAEKERGIFQQIAKGLGVDAELLEKDPNFIKGKRYDLEDLRKKFPYKAPVSAQTDQTTLRHSVIPNVADTTKVIKADTTGVKTPMNVPTTFTNTPADQFVNLKDKAETLKKGTTQTKVTTGQPAAKKSSKVVEVDEEFKEGGSVGKRRVLIHSLGEYKTGGALKRYDEGGKTTETKKIDHWEHSPKSGNYRPVYTDGTKGAVQSEVPVVITPYTGADAPSKYTEDQWQEFAKEIGFKPTTHDPVEQNREFQHYLAQHKDWGPKVAALHQEHGIPKKTGKQFDALLGKRWDAIMDQRPAPAPKKQPAPTPPAAETKTPPVVPDYGPYAEHLKEPRVPSVPPRFTVQDTLKMGNLALDYLGTKGFYPWSAKPAFHTPDTVFRSPERQYAKIGELYNTAAQNLATFGDPRQFNARLSQLTGEAMKNVADVAANVEGENVRIANEMEARNAAAMNQYNQAEAARLTSDWDKFQTVNENLYNQKRFGRNAMTNQLANSVTNMANIYNLNQLYPQYAVNPAGMLYFKNPRDIKPDYSKQKTVVDYYNQILEENEHLRNQPQIALKMAESMAGVKPKSDQADEWLRASKGVIPSYASNVNPYGYNDEEQV